VLTNDEECEIISDMSKIPEDKLQWLFSLMPYAKEAEKLWPGMRAEVCVAQAALETGWGKRTIGGWNLWGMKSMKWVPGAVDVVTKEWDRETRDYVTVTAKFCAFPSPQEGFNAYGRLVNNSPAYRSARDAVDRNSYIRELGKVWATDPQYSEKIMLIIKEAGLGN
jgi:peptidoglycan hydrolase FlgJ